ncbi:hypothetical protein C1H76_1133 [Elsinoe australis]|uniref:Uncharacterized protein n=1 Tax=Elsinoe australis TaxID=40998 RepID=A0A4U7B9L0_9PEZI|nr:hypothetical protein C1H76_1133 [Elsinoe australis]
MTLDAQQPLATIINRSNYVFAAVFLNVNLNMVVRIAARHGYLDPRLKSYITDVNYAFEYIMLAATTLDLLRCGFGFFRPFDQESEMSALTLLATSPIGILAMEDLSLIKIILAVLSLWLVTCAVKVDKYYFRRESRPGQSVPDAI